MGIFRKENGVPVPKAGFTGTIDNILNKFSNNAVSNKAVTEEIDRINADLTDNSKSFKFGYDSVNDQYGYYKEEAGADTFVPFKASLEYITFSKTNAINSSSYIYTDSIDTNSDSTKFVKVDGYADAYSHTNGTSCTIVAQGSDDNITWSNIKSTSFTRPRQSSGNGSTGWIPTTYRYLRAGGNGGSDGNVNSTLTIESYF